MDCLECSKENYHTNYHKNSRIIHGVFLCTWIVKRREQLHNLNMTNLEFKNNLPHLEICDQLFDPYIFLFNAIHVFIAILQKYLIENGK